MKKLYSIPLRVYLILGLLALLGIYAGLDLPISLYPNSNKPAIQTGVNYGNSTAQEFLQNYGKEIEAQLKNISVDGIKVEKLKAEYSGSRVFYRAVFGWCADPKEALKEVKSTMNSLSSRWPTEIRDSLWSNYWSKSSGFIAVSYYSKKRSIDELYALLDPLLTPKVLKVEDANDAGLFNPNKKEIHIEIKPEAMATLGLFPSDIKNAIDLSTVSMGGGNIKIGLKKIQYPNASACKRPR